MYKFIYINLFCLFLCFQATAQQEVQFTQFMSNKLYYNPAYAGVRGGPSAKAMYRSQWIGFDGAPKSRLVSFDLPLFNDKVGFGLTFLNYDQGITSSWQTSMAYSYNVKIKEEVTLRFGFQGALRYYGIDFNDPDFIVLQKNDPSILQDMTTKNYYGNFGFGTFLLYKQFYAGLSIPNFYGNDIGFNPGNLEQFAKETKHYYGMAGSSHKLNSNIQIRPAVLVKYVQNAPVDLDFNVNLTFNKMLTLGLSYRAGGEGAGESIDLLGMYQFTKFAFGLSYDVGISSLKNHSAGSFEALVRYDFKREATDIENPRFFY